MGDWRMYSASEKLFSTMKDIKTMKLHICNYVANKKSTSKAKCFCFFI